MRQPRLLTSVVDPAVTGAAAPHNPHTTEPLTLIASQPKPERRALGLRFGTHACEGGRFVRADAERRPLARPSTPHPLRALASRAKSCDGPFVSRHYVLEAFAGLAKAMERAQLVRDRAEAMRRDAWATVATSREIRDRAALEFSRALSRRAIERPTSDR